MVTSTSKIKHFDFMGLIFGRGQLEMVKWISTQEIKIRVVLKEMNKQPPQVQEGITMLTSFTVFKFQKPEIKPVNGDQKIPVTH